MNPYRKQTRIWVTKEGQRLRICDMTDSHLDNTITMFDRALGSLQRNLPYPCFNGEMAQYYAEMEWDRLMESSPDEQWPIYNNLVEDKHRREWLAEEWDIF